MGYFPAVVSGIPFDEEINISIPDQITAALKYVDVAHITERGRTILWDLMQEDIAVSAYNSN